MHPLPHPVTPGAAAALAVFSSREDLRTLVATVEAALRAAPGVVDQVDVLVNGNPGLAADLAAALPSLLLPDAPLHLRVWRFTLGDKAHTWNEYIERLAPSDRLCFCVDGYAAVEAAALHELVNGVKGRQGVLAATGVPTVGLGAGGLARELQAHGGIHGNLFMLLPRTIEQMRRVRFRLPLGLYRTDATIGAALSFGLGLEERTWQPQQRILVCPSANWRIEPLRWWRPEDLRTHWRRFRRQAQGDLENAAVRHFYYVKQEEFGALPRTAADLVRAWAAAAPAEFAGVLRKRRFARESYDRMLTPRDWSAAAEPPTLLAERHTPPAPEPDTLLDARPAAPTGTP